MYKNFAHLKRSIKTRFLDYLFLVGSVLRPFLGQRGVCIFLVDCPSYARAQLQNRMFPLALILIALRVFSCNPITAFVRRWSSAH